MSTPIETNTEDLREILQAVYDLKNSAGGGSGGVSWDCVIEANGTAMDKISCSVASGSLRSVFNKLASGEKPNVILRYFVDNNGTVCRYFSECLNMNSIAEDNVEGLALFFIFKDWYICVYANGSDAIDNNSLEVQKYYLLYD